MSTRSALLGLLLTLPAAGLLTAQAPTPPKPGPEQQNLAFFVGRWNETADVKPGPMGPGGKVTESSTCEWFTGGFYVVCHADGNGPGGATHSLGILGYNAARKRYSYYGVDATPGPADPFYGDFAGDTWTWDGEATMGGQSLKFRYTIVQHGTDSYSFKGEVSVAGGPWAVTIEGTNTRVK